MDIIAINQRPCGKVLYEAMQNSIIKRVKRIFIVQALSVVINVRSLFKQNELRPVAIACNERVASRLPLPPPRSLLKHRLSHHIIRGGMERKLRPMCELYLRTNVV